MLALRRAAMLRSVAVWLPHPINADTILDEAARTLWPTLWPVIADMLAKQRKV